MNWFKIYKETKLEKEFLEHRINDLSQEYEFWYRQCHHGHRKPVAPLDITLERMKKVMDDVKEYMYLLEIKKNTLKQMDKQLSKLGNTEQIVVKLHEFDGKTHKQIAKELNFTVEWIKELSAEGKKKLAT